MARVDNSMIEMRQLVTPTNGNDEVEESSSIDMNKHSSIENTQR